MRLETRTQDVESPARSSRMILEADSEGHESSKEPHEDREIRVHDAEASEHRAELVDSFEPFEKKIDSRNNKKSETMIYTKQASSISTDMMNPSRLSPPRPAERAAQKAQFKLAAHNDPLRVEAIRHRSKSSSSGNSNFSLRPTEQALKPDKLGSGIAMTSAHNSSHALFLESQLMRPNYTAAPVTATVVEEPKVVLKEAGKRAHLNRARIKPLELESTEKVPVQYRQIKSKVSPTRHMAPLSEAPMARTPTLGERQKAGGKSEISTQINVHGLQCSQHSIDGSSGD
jgi:hypothetical protein